MNLPTKEQHALSVNQLYKKDKWSSPIYLCPKCKVGGMCRDDSFIYASVPPQHDYKCNKCGSSAISEWLWDPFNFDVGVIRGKICRDIYISNSVDVTELTQPTLELPTYVTDSKSVSNFFGDIPLSPTIIFAPDNTLEGLDTGYEFIPPELIPSR